MAKSSYGLRNWIKSDRKFKKKVLTILGHNEIIKYLSIFFFSFFQKTNFLLYHRPGCFCFCLLFRWLYTLLNHYSSISRNAVIACFSTKIHKTTSTEQVSIWNSRWQVKRRCLRVWHKIFEHLKWSSLTIRYWEALKPC